MLLDNAMDLVAKKIPPPTPEEKGRSFCLERNARSLSAGARFKMPEAISPISR